MEVKAENGTIKLTKAVEDALLMTGIIRPDAMLPTPEAAQANKVLKSLQQKQPLDTGKGIAVKNPVTGVFGYLKPSDKGLDVGFTTKGGFERPKGPQSRVQQLGVKATVNQLVDQIPTARNNPENLDARYTFEAIQDAKDLERDIKREKPLGSTNQRATAYDRMTKGAFKAYPKPAGRPLHEIPRWIGYGERIDQTRWQPRDAKGKYGKYVNFDPTEPVKQLGKIAAQMGAVRFVPQIGKTVQAISTVDDLAEAAFGVRPSQKIVEEQQKQVSKTVEKRPDYNIGSILPF